jgi:hypothetical protein
MRALVAVATLLLVTACGADSDDTATDPTGEPTALMPTAIPAAKGPVTGFGLVIDKEDGPEFCLGPVAESYPPQCSGIPLAGWRWEDHRGEFDNASGVRFGSFAVTGTFDGTTMTAQDAVSGAVYDPMPVPEPTSGAAEDHTPAELEAIAEEVRDLPGFLTAMPGDNLVAVDVVHDEGSLQAWADAAYGTGLVFVRSALSPLTAG